jgi:hypothetical protein
MKMAEPIMPVNPRTETPAKNSKSGINSTRSRHWRMAGRRLSSSIEEGFRSDGTGTRPRHPSVSRLTHAYSASDFLCLFGFAHSHKSCFEYEQGVPRRFSTGTEESLHCGTEDEIALRSPRNFLGCSSSLSVLRDIGCSHAFRKGWRDATGRHASLRLFRPTASPLLPRSALFLLEELNSATIPTLERLDNQHARSPRSE